MLSDCTKSMELPSFDNLTLSDMDPPREKALLPGLIAAPKRRQELNFLGKFAMKGHRARNGRGGLHDSLGRPFGLRSQKSSAARPAAGLLATLPPTTTIGGGF